MSFSWSMELVHETGAGVAVGKMVADASEGLVEVVLGKGFALLIKVRRPRVVEGVQVAHGGGGDTGVVNVDVGDGETVGRLLVKDASVAD